VSFLIAGRDTTTQALTWFFYRLSANPIVEAKLREEIKKTS
jgi:cytochrome P450